MLKIYLYIMIMFLVSNFVLASDDILDEIVEGLEKGETIQEQSFYPVDLFKALVDKDSYILYKELYLSGYYSSELKQVAGRNSAGFILFGTFSGPKGQIGDANMQFRAVYYKNQFIHGVKMGREYTNDFELELHNAYLRLRVLPPMFNVRIGHFYVPYGLQPWIDTHGTLLESPAMEFIGLDRDWGVSVEGQNDKLEYQAGLTRGSGMEYSGQDKNFLLAGKLSTPRIGEHVNDWLGVSFLTGRISGEERLSSQDADEMDEEKIISKIHEKWRAGFDGQKVIGPARLRFEISGGQDERKENILGEFVEVKYALGKSSRWLASIQLENLTQDINHPSRSNDTTARFGLTYSLSANYNLQFVASWGKKDTWLGLLFYGQKGGGLLDW